MTEQDQIPYNKIKTLLSQGKTYVGVPFGVSMWPMLHNKKDIIVIEPLTGEDELKVGDVAVFERNNNLVLHRIVKTKCDNEGNTLYLFWGDNCANADGYIPRKSILGRLSTCFRKGKELDLNSDKYRFYVDAWRVLRPARVAMKRGKSVAGRLVRKAGLLK